MITLAGPPFHIDPIRARRHLPLPDVLLLFVRARNAARDQHADTWEQLAVTMHGHALLSGMNDTAAHGFVEPMRKRAAAFREPEIPVERPPQSRDARRFYLGETALREIEAAEAAEAAARRAAGPPMPFWLELDADGTGEGD